MQKDRPHWSETTKLVISLLLLALGVFLLYRFSAVIRPFILAVIIAYLLFPLANWLEIRYGIRRGIAALLAYLIALVSLIIIPVVVIPPLMAQSSYLNLDIQRISQDIDSLLANQYRIGGYEIDIKSTIQQLVIAMQGIVEPLFRETIGYLIELITSLAFVVFIVIVSFYLVKDGAKLSAWFVSITPERYKADFLRLKDELNQIWSAFFRGQLVLGVVVAIIFTVIGFGIGLPFALVMGLLAGVLEFLPSVGHGIWLVIAILLSIFIGSTWLPVPNWMFALIVTGLHLFYQQFDINYLIPRIIGRRVQLHPLVVILGIVAGALLAGILGILIAAPTIASARVLGRYIYANLLNQDPFPDTVTEVLLPPKARWWDKSEQSERAED